MQLPSYVLSEERTGILEERKTDLDEASKRARAAMLLVRRSGAFAYRSALLVELETV